MLNKQCKGANLSFDVPKYIVYINLSYVGDQTSELTSDVRSLLNRVYP